MNKEEVKKSIKAVFDEECKECYFPTRRKCSSCVRENKKKIKKYINELEQKESLLDKVTDELLKDKKELTEELKYNITKREARLQLILVDKILNIIEERQYCCNCGVELNSENKALDNMCNECKYGLEY